MYRTAACISLFLRVVCNKRACYNGSGMVVAITQKGKNMKMKFAENKNAFLKRNEVKNTIQKQTENKNAILKRISTHCAGLAC